MNDKTLYEEILERADIVTVISSYIDVIKKGKSYVALCPFHNDSDPSMMISKDKQIFKCFVCGTSGNAISFVQHYEKISYKEALKKVAEIIGYDDPRLHSNEYVKKVDTSLEPIINCINDLNLYYQYTLSSDEGVEAKKYLLERGIDTAIINKFSIGFAPKDGSNTIKYLSAKSHSLKTIENTGIASINGLNNKDNNAGRIIFPIHDGDGQVIGFSARKMPNDDSTSKYINSPETPLFHKSTVLYNLHNAKQAAKLDNCIYILEGFMDVIALERVGIKNAIALMGTALSNEHLEILKRLNVEIRLCLDGDVPGQRATMKAVASLNSKNINCRIVDNRNDARDPDDIYKQEGEDGLKKYVSNLIEPFDFIMNFYTNTSKLETKEAKEKLIHNVVDTFILSLEPRSLEFENSVTRLSKVTLYDEKVIKNYIERRRKSKATENENDFNVNIFSHSDFSLRSARQTKKELRRLLNCEKEVLFHMFNENAAIAYYSKNIESFVDELYRSIANFIVAQEQRSGKLDVSVLISDIESQIDDINKKEEMKKTIFDINSEQNHPPYSEALMDDCHKIITSEKDKLYQKEKLQTSTLGKTDEEKARIYNDYNRRKTFEKNNK